jgi:hypothetical protein
MKISSRSAAYSVHSPRRTHLTLPSAVLHLTIPIYLSIRRAQDRLGVKMADLSLATRLADALNREYIDAHGWKALQVD